MNEITVTKMKTISFSCRLSLGLSYGLIAIAAACGNSKSDDASTDPANGGGMTTPMTGTGSLQPGSNGTATGNTEGNPGNVALDPNRDPAAPINLVESGAVTCGGNGTFCIAPALTCCVGP
jgi:hypothetical protein